MNIENLEEKKQFSGMIKSLAFNAGIRSFGNTEDDKEVLKFYFEALKEFSINDVLTAGKAILRDWKPSSYYNNQDHRIPPISEFIERLEGKKQKLEDAAVIQATKIIENLKTHGRTKFPEDIDNIATKLMQSRWNYSRWAAEVIESDLVWWVKEFKEAYAAFSESDNIKSIAPPEKMRPLLNRITKRICE